MECHMEHRALALSDDHLEHNEEKLRKIHVRMLSAKWQPFCS